MSQSNAAEVAVENDLVENVNDETEKVNPLVLVFTAVRSLDTAQKKKLAAEKAAEKAEEECQKHLERLYDLTDEGDLHIIIPINDEEVVRYQVRKKRGRATGFEMKKVEQDKVLDLSTVESDDDDDEQE